MKDYAWYMSHIQDPFSDDAMADQGDLNERWNLQYKCDSIKELIGTHECSHSIDLFWNEIQSNLDDQSTFEYCNDLFLKMIEVYHMDYLQEFCDNKRDINYILEVESLLLFLEKNYIDIFIMCLVPIFDINVKMDETQIKKYFSTIYQELGKNFSILPLLFQEFLKYSNINDITFCLNILIQKQYWKIESGIIEYNLKQKINNEQQ